ncbi:hypothetical protein [Streptomyces sp. A1547]|uniref:hypothetical protein n=1 Tax=Streptomyces sp. A1547 TaxID=2563105 RepID=UPI0019CFC60F
MRGTSVCVPGFQSLKSPTTLTGPGTHSATFSTVKLRTKVTRGASSAAAALAVVFELAESAQEPWRAITAPHLVARVRAGDRFGNGHLVERPEADAA